MRLYRPTYKSRKGKVKTLARWYVDLRDHLGSRLRLPAFPDKKSSLEYGRKLEMLVDCRLSGRSPEAELRNWLESLPSALILKLISLGILDNGQASAVLSLRDHLRDYEKALTAKADSPRHVAQEAKKIHRVLDGTQFVH